MGMACRTLSAYDRSQRVTSVLVGGLTAAAGKRRAKDPAG
jgi:hypothetical protein